MKWANETTQQHFVSQVEQRFNAINPQAKSNNQKIYSFEVINRESHEIRLLDPNGHRIYNTLAYPDLFSFDVENGSPTRMNFESAFHRYESKAKTLTESLIQKLTSQQNDVNEEVVNLFTVKLLNMARNPFAIHKMLNTFGSLTNYEPTAPEHLATFERILKGRKPHQAHLCHELGITDTEYRQWLIMLFMLFIPSGDGELNLLESIVKSNLINHEREIAIFVGFYSSPSCLLSDRSFSTNTDKPGVDGFDFNLTSRAFIRYIFADIDALARAISPHTPSALIVNHKNRLKILPRPIKLHYEIDNLEKLRGFNRNVIYQSHKHVYCASPTSFI